MTEAEDEGAAAAVRRATPGDGLSHTGVGTGGLILSSFDVPKELTMPSGVSGEVDVPSPRRADDATPLPGWQGVDDVGFPTSEESESTNAGQDARRDPRE